MVGHSVEATLSDAAKNYCHDYLPVLQVLWRHLNSPLHHKPPLQCDHNFLANRASFSQRNYCMYYSTKEVFLVGRPCTPAWSCAVVCWYSIACSSEILQQTEAKLWFAYISSNFVWNLLTISDTTKLPVPTSKSAAKASPKGKEAAPTVTAATNGEMDEETLRKNREKMAERMRRSASGSKLDSKSVLILLQIGC